MKKFLISTLLLAGWTGHAASLPDSVAMTVGDKKVSVAEFLFSAEKNGETNLADKKNLESFVQLFGNFKLKVVDAEAQGLDQTQAFKDEQNSCPAIFRTKRRKMPSSPKNIRAWANC